MGNILFLNEDMGNLLEKIIDPMAITIRVDDVKSTLLLAPNLLILLINMLKRMVTMSTFINADALSKL